MTTPLRVLIVEDAPDDAELMVLRLVEEGFEPDWQRVQSEKDFLAALETNPDLILADWRLPRFGGLRALKLMKERGLDIPFIIVSGSIGEEAAVDALRQGADDYVLKDRPARLGQAVRHALEDKQIRQEREQAEAALHESEEKYRSLVERANDGITIIQGGIVKFANIPLVDLWGGTLEEVLESPFANYIHPDELPAMIKRYQQRMAGENIPPLYETVLRRRDGSKVYVEINAGVITYLGKPADLVVVRDVTERKQAEEKIKQRNEELSLLNAINQAVNRGESLENIIRLIAKETKPLFNCFGVTLHLLSPDRQRLVMQNLVIPPALAKKIEKLIGIPIPRIEHDLQTAHPYRQVLESSRSQVINGIESIQEFTAAYLLAAPLPDKIRTRLKRLVPTIVKSLGYQSVLIVPMIADDEIIGTLDMGRREPFTEEDAKRLESIANQLTAAIKRKQAGEALRQRAEELAALQATVLEITAPHDLPSLLHTIVERAAHLLEANSGGLYLCDPSKEEVRCVVSYNTPSDYTGTVLKYGEGAAGVVAQTGKPLVIDDYRTWGGRAAAFDAEQPFMAVLSAPMIWQGQVTGVIHVLHSTEGRLFSQAELALLTQFANHAAVAVENARLYGDAQREIAERKQAEEEIAENARLMEALFTNHLTCLVLLDRDFNFIRVNEAYARACAREVSEFPGHNHFEFYPSEARAIFEEVVRTKKPFQVSARPFAFPDHPEWGVTYWDWTLVPILDRGGEVEFLVFSLNNVSERVKAEEAQRESEAQFRALVEQSITGITVIQENKFVYINPRMAEIFGYTQDEMIGKKPADFVVEAHRESVQESLRKRLAGEIPSAHYNFRGRRKDGSEIEVEVYGSTLMYQGRSAVLSTLLDITERKQAEEALKISEEKYRSLFENIPDGVYQTTPDGQILAANPALVSMLGYDSEEELLKTQIADLYFKPGDRKIDIGYFRENDVVRNIEIRLRCKGGTPIIALDNAHAARDEHGEVVYFEGTLTDITTLKQAEATLKSQADELRQRNAELALLYEAGLTINRELDPSVLLENLFQTAMKALQADHAEFSRYDAARGIVQFELGIGYSPEALEKLGSLVVRDDEEDGLIGMVVHKRQPLNLPDVYADPRYIDVDPAIRSGLWVPVERENQLLGVIGVLSTRPAAFTDQHERLLLLFANQAAVALENARLFEETSRRLKHVQTLRTIDMVISSSLDLQMTFDVFLEQAVRQLEVHAADILLFNPHTQTLEYMAGRGFRTAALQHTYLHLGESLAGRAALERRIVHIPDLVAEPEGLARAPKLADEGFVAYFGAPLIAKGLVKGVLEVFHRAPLEADQEWLDFLDTLAGQAAIAIDNVTLFEDLQRSNVELTLAYDATIEGWSRALDLRDKEAEGHTQRVIDLTLRLARAMGVSDAEQVHMRRGVLLHDIGKMGVPDDILRNPGPLSEEEWAIMRQHPVYAYEMLSPVRYLRPALDIPYCHHEKWDGSGSPRGLKGEQIPLAARIFAVVDVYDALTSDRPYRKAWSREEALEYIRQQAGRHFEPGIVSAFMGMPGLHE